MLQIIEAVNRAVNGVVWGIPMLAVLVGTGLFLSVRTGFVQFRKFGCAMGNTLGKLTSRQSAGSGEITPFQAVTTALAATVGTGNIVGVTGAIVLGGPGAVFWMWIAALLGMATKYAEVVLSVRFRERNPAGDWVGGPMYYIKNGLPGRWHWLGTLFCVFGILASFGIGNIAQIHSIAESVHMALQSFVPQTDGYASAIGLTVGILMAGCTALVLLGGVKRIGAVTEKLVPGMAAVYMLGALTVVLVHGDRLGAAFGLIFRCAFRPDAILGGTAGTALAQVVRIGVGRGVFSNEAGLGSAPMAHAATSETDPEQQGLCGIFEVFADTVVICTLTALTVLCSGVVDGNYGVSAMAGVSTTVRAFATVFGQRVSSLLIAVGMTLFASSTLFCWSLYGGRCWEYLFGSKSVGIYRFLFVLVVIAGATMELGLVWSISETLNGLMALPNLAAVLALSGVAAAPNQPRQGGAGDQYGRSNRPLR